MTIQKKCGTKNFKKIEFALLVSKTMANCLFFNLNLVPRHSIILYYATVLDRKTKFKYV